MVLLGDLQRLYIHSVTSTMHPHAWMIGRDARAPCADLRPSNAMTDDDLPPLPAIPPGLYRHYKNLPYEVLGTARHSETLEPLVVYRALYGARGLWVRPAAMFMETVVVDGVVRARFARCSEDSGEATAIRAD